MSIGKHTWTWAQIHFAAECWRSNMSCERIADAILERFGFVVTKNSIISLSRRHRDLMPVKSADDVEAARLRGWRRAFELTHAERRGAA